MEVSIMRAREFSGMDFFGEKIQAVNSFIFHELEPDYPL